MEFFEVELVKDTQGLGITIAGYVGERTSGAHLCTVVASRASLSVAAGSAGVTRRSAENSPHQGFSFLLGIAVIKIEIGNVSVFFNLLLQDIHCILFSS